MRKTPFVVDEFYHIYNRGVDKRPVVIDQNDADRFLQSIIEFNVRDPIGSIYEVIQKKSSKKAFLRYQAQGTLQEKLVNIVSFRLNPNHYHFLLQPQIPEGIEKFMQKLGNGYTKYFNHRYKRSGSLFQGRFKSIHIDTNEYLLHVSAYVNLNNFVHGIPEDNKLRLPHSWDEFRGISKTNLYYKSTILSQFKNSEEYVQFALSSLEEMKRRKVEEKDLQKILIELE